MAYRFSIRTIRRLPFIQGFTQIEILVIVFIIGILATVAAPSLGGMLEAARMKQTAVEIRSAFQETQRQSIRNNQSCEARVVIASQDDRSSLIKGSCLSSGDRPLPKGIGLATNVMPDPPSGSSGSDSSGSSSSGSSGSRGSSSSSDSSDSTMPPQNNDDDDDDNISLEFNPTTSKVHRAGIGDVLCYFRSEGSCDTPSTSSRSEPDIEVGIQFGHLGSAKFQIASADGDSSSNSHSAKFISFRPNRLEAKKSCVVLSGSLGLTRIGTYHGTLDPADITANGKCQVAAWTEQ